MAGVRGQHPAGVDAVRIAEFQRRLGYGFDNQATLVDALTHRSWAAEHEGCDTNERLEFLGDAVLGCAIAELCYRQLPTWGEGRLTALRKGVVNASALADLARRIDLGPLIRLGRGESLAGGSDKGSILSDAFEAVIGAILVDGGHRAADDVIEQLFTPLIEEAKQNLDRLDEKTTLQEFAARLGCEPPSYSITSSGPDHEKHFAAEVAVAGVTAVGVGSSKKTAQKAAAHEAVNALLSQHPELAP